MWDEERGLVVPKLHRAIYTAAAYQLCALAYIAKSHSQKPQSQDLNPGEGNTTALIHLQFGVLVWRGAAITLARQQLLTFSAHQEVGKLPRGSLFR